MPLALSRVQVTRQKEAQSGPRGTGNRRFTRCPTDHRPSFRRVTAHTSMRPAQRLARRRGSALGAISGTPWTRRLRGAHGGEHGAGDGAQWGGEAAHGRGGGAGGPVDGGAAAGAAVNDVANRPCAPRMATGSGERKKLGGHGCLNRRAKQAVAEGLCWILARRQGQSSLHPRIGMFTAFVIQDAGRGRRSSKGGDEHDEPLVRRSAMQRLRVVLNQVSDIAINCFNDLVLRAPSRKPS